MAIAQYDPRHYVDRHPEPHEILWLIEIGDATRLYDRTRKMPLYALHRVREVWLVDLVERKLVVGRSPTDLGYADFRELRHGEIVPEALPDVVFGVEELLGPSH